MDRIVDNYIKIFEYTTEMNLDINKAVIVKNEMEEYLNENQVNDKRLLLKIYML